MLRGPSLCRAVPVLHSRPRHPSKPRKLPTTTCRSRLLGSYTREVRSSPPGGWVVNQKDKSAWEEAQRRCRLSDAEVRMARELGRRPKSLIKNIPARSQQWKMPVSEWVRSLYEKKIGSRRQAGG